MDTVMEKQQARTVLRQIKIEHDTVRELSARIAEAQTANWQDMKTIYTALSGHFYAEEEVVFPALASISDQAAELVENLIEEHRLVIEGLIKMIDKQEFNKSEFKMIKGSLEEHFQKEEYSGFKAANENMTTEQLQAALEPFEEASAKGKEKANKY